MSVNKMSNGKWYCSFYYTDWQGNRKGVKLLHSTPLHAGLYAVYVLQLYVSLFILALLSFRDFYPLNHRRKPCSNLV